jgi:PAS domain-containing protein
VPSEAALERTVFDLLSPHEPERLSSALEEIARADVSKSLRLRGMRAESAAFDSWFNLFPIHDARGRIDTIGAIGRDISEFVKLEREQALLASLVKSSEDGILSVGMDGKVTSWNAAAEKLFGFRAAEAIGADLVDLLIPPSGATARGRGWLVNSPRPSVTARSRCTIPSPGAQEGWQPTGSIGLGFGSLRPERKAAGRLHLPPRYQRTETRRTADLANGIDHRGLAGPGGSG